MSEPVADLNDPKRVAPRSWDDEQDPGRGGGGPNARIAAVILAAGGSRRLGRPKQLVEVDGEPLVRRAARAALEAGLSPVVVVVAPGAAAVTAALGGLAVDVVENPDAGTGVASSVRAGVARVPATAGAVVLVACDQPRLDAAHLRRLVEAHRASGAAVVASEYAGVRGVPALLGRAVLAEVDALTGDAGARDIVRREPARTLGVPFEGGELDLDVPADLQRLGGERD